MRPSKGYNNFVVQGLRLEPFNIKYRLERWVSPDGSSFTGKLVRLCKEINHLYILFVARLRCLCWRLLHSLFFNGP